MHDREDCVEPSLFILASVGFLMCFFFKKFFKAYSEIEIWTGEETEVTSHPQCLR